MTLKLKPKSTPAMLSESQLATTCVYDCGVTPEPERLEKFWLFEPRAASLKPGFSPPTRFVTGTALPPLASVRNVCTGTHVEQLDPRDERTVPLTTRTRYVPVAKEPVLKE